MRALPVLLAALALAPALAPALGDAPPAPPPNVRVTNANGPANEVDIAVNPTDPLDLVAGAKDYTLGASRDCGVHRVWAGYYWSRDGGHTWGNGLLPGYPGDPGPPTALTGYPCASDPVVAFDGLGFAHYLGVAYNGPQGLDTLFLAMSLDGGATWPVIVPVATVQGAALFDDKPWLAVDPVTNVAYVTWTEFTPLTASIMLVRCALGVACGAPQPLSLPAVEATQGSSVAVGPDGAVHVVWMDYAHGRVAYAKAPAGLAFLPDVPIARLVATGSQPNSAYRTPSMPAIAVDRSGGPLSSGAVYVVWTDARRDMGDVVGVRSADGGATWSKPFFVNDDAPGHSNFFPSIAVAPGGRVDVGFYDRRDDPGNKLDVLYVASSRDGGLTWPNTRVGSVAFDGDLGYHQGGFPFIGDYLGMASTGDLAHPVWADTRDGSSQVYTAAVPR